MRQRLLRLSGLLAAVLLLQWAVGMAACVASMAAPGGPDPVTCHDESGAASSAPGVPPAHKLAASACPLCLQLSATVLPGPPALLPGPPPIHVAVPLPAALHGPLTARFSPAHPARGLPGFS